MIDGFENPKMLFLLLSVPPLFVYAWYHCNSLQKALSSVLENGSKSIMGMLRIRSLLFLCAWISLIIASAGPFGGERYVAHRQEGASVFFVMDVSSSMTVNDILPNRIERSAEYASVLLDYLGGIPCGLILSKGNPVLSVPLTRAHLSLRTLLDSLSPAMLTSAGSSPGKGIIKALESFSENRSEAKIIILCTDGDETDSFLLAGAERVRLSGATLVVIGFGTATGSPIEIIVPPGQSATIRTVLNSTVLLRACEIAGADSFYIDANDAGAIHKVLELISSKQYATNAVGYVSRPLSRRHFFLLLSLLLFLAGILVRGLVWRK